MGDPPARPSHRLCDADELEDGECMPLEVEGRVLVLARVDGRYHALDGLCPHRGAPLGNGSIEGTVLRCPWHGWAFDLRRGELVMNPATRLATYPVVVEEGSVRVTLEDRPATDRDR